GLSDALRTIQYHDGLFGWHFFDTPETDYFAPWSDRLSYDVCTEGSRGFSHTFTAWSEELVVGRETRARQLIDLRVWFDDLFLTDRLGRTLDLDETIASARRYWHHVSTRGSGGPSPYPVPPIPVADGRDVPDDR